MGKSSPSNRATEVRSAGDQRWRQASDEEVWKGEWRCLGGGGGRTVMRKRREGCWRDRGEIETDMQR